MTLTPETRVLLTDALRPPAGYRIDVAVGTTYSLNLTALLLAPLSFALYDQETTEDPDAVDPIRLLEAVRRHAEHTTVFCQAGGIHVPTNYRSILTFVEDSVSEVMPFHEGAIFHPKIWALRFVDQDGHHLHRVVVLSRNMTLDRSWDTALVLDEATEGMIAAAPAADFVRRLPALALRPLAGERLGEIDDLVATLTHVRLAAPSPFTSGELLPMGLSSDRVWPFPDRARRLLAISPFVTKGTLDSLGSITTKRTLVARAESLDRMGATTLRGWDVNVLQRLAEVGMGEDVGESADNAPDGMLSPNEGLHAKTFVIDLEGSRSRVVTGSANLTGAAWNRNVEFNAMLTGPTPSCGVSAVLDDKDDVPGLVRVLEEYSAAECDGVPDSSIQNSWALEMFHQQLAAGGPVLDVGPTAEGRCTVTLTLPIPTNPPGVTQVWLASLPGQTMSLDCAASWEIAPENVTAFIAVETTLGTGDARATRRCVLKAALTGAVGGRRQDAIFSILKSKEDVLRYLVFLLGDPAYDALFAQMAGLDDQRFAGADRPGFGNVEVALFEPLVRAVGQDEDALARVASLIEDIRQLPNGNELVPDGFDELWDVVWQVHQEKRS